MPLFILKRLYLHVVQNVVLVRPDVCQNRLQLSLHIPHRLQAVVGLKLLNQLHCLDIDYVKQLLQFLVQRVELLLVGVVSAVLDQLVALILKCYHRLLELSQLPRLVLRDVRAAVERLRRLDQERGVREE